jgi:phospholipase C
MPPSMLSVPAAEAPVDTVVIVMMENRSFDHYFGWLPTDDAYMESGLRRYGDGFGVDGDNRQSYVGPDGKTHATHYLGDHEVVNDPSRGCGHPDPGHGWDQGRAQRDHGFLAKGSGFRVRPSLTMAELTQPR